MERTWSAVRKGSSASTLSARPGNAWTFGLQENLDAPSGPLDFLENLPAYPGWMNSLFGRGTTSISPFQSIDGLRLFTSYVFFLRKRFQMP
jgi:hypothetical protein